MEFTVNSRRLNGMVAHHQTTQDWLDDYIVRTEDKAKALLDAEPKHRTGNSYIETEKEGTDRFLVLVDPGDKDYPGSIPGAMSIEFGRHRKSPMAGLFILHRAVGRLGKGLGKRKRG